MIALVEIDAKRLGLVCKLVQKNVDVAGGWTVLASMNCREVIEGSHFIINQIEVGTPSSILPISWRNMQVFLMRI